MPFDLARFEAAKFEARKARVSVEALAPFFAEGETPEWEVRGLSASELYLAMEAQNRQGNIETIIRAIATKQEQISAIKSALGIAGDTPGEIAKRLEMIVAGSVSPKIELAQAVKLAETFPIEFMLITNQIIELTGKGADVVKPDAASQKTPD